MDVETRTSVDRRLARIEGQVRGLRRMVEEDQSCCDVLTQLSAVRSALDQTAAELAAAHVKRCIVGHGTETEHAQSKRMSSDELRDELNATLSRLMR